VNSSARLTRCDHLTYKGNPRSSRFGWLRLTPAYSVHQVESLLESSDPNTTVLDPFCGTGTTALVCAELGLACDTTDINPFLIWLATAKGHTYSSRDVDCFLGAATEVAEAMRSSNGETSWVPALHQIEKWWDEPTLAALGHAMAKIRSLEATLPAPVTDLLKVAFCRTMMGHAHVTFGHQSMSFKRRETSRTLTLPGFGHHPVAETWEHAISLVAVGARKPIIAIPRVILLDSRFLDGGLSENKYSLVITSPPYPNRMSYIRELRPYMYWLGYLSDGRAAGELDWKAIGGTWGCATSNLNTWSPGSDVLIPYADFGDILRRISSHSDILSRYVHKYFVDMVEHCHSLFRVVKPGGIIHYIVGNSKFYDVLLPVESIFAAIFDAVGFSSVTVQATRKRTSKKELFEFVVSARKPR
jgi:DNA modification methylase